MDASMRASQCTHTYIRTHARTHARMYTGGCIFAVWESGDARGAARWLKKGAICRAMAGTPRAWECQWGDTYIHATLPFRYIFCLAPDFFSVASSCLRAYDAASSLPTLPARKPPPKAPLTPGSSRLWLPFDVRHAASCGARRFLFQIFSISMRRDFADGTDPSMNETVRDRSR